MAAGGGLDEARRIASNIAKLPNYLAANHRVPCGTEIGGTPLDDYHVLTHVGERKYR
jgi:hypothetical protein